MSKKDEVRYMQIMAQMQGIMSAAQMMGNTLVYTATKEGIDLISEMAGIIIGLNEQINKKEEEEIIH